MAQNESGTQEEHAVPIPLLLKFRDHPHPLAKMILSCHEKEREEFLLHSEGIRVNLQRPS